MTAREFHWLMVARWAATGLLAAAAAVLPDALPLFIVAAALGAFNVAVQSAAARGPSRWRRLACLALLADVAALTAFLRFSGDLENPMRSAYALPVIAAALVVSRRFSLVVAAVAFTGFAGLIAAIGPDGTPLDHRHMPRFSVEHHPEHRSGYVTIQFSYLAVLLGGSALGFGALARRLRSSEKDVLQENERMQILLNALPDGVVLLRRDGSVLLSNPAANPLMAELAAAMDLPSMIETLTGASVEFETRMGDRIYAGTLAQASPGDPVVWTFRDRTEQRRLMAQIIHGSKMADLGLLAAGIAHEIGNPLSSMSAIVQMLKRKTVDPAVTERIGALNSSIDRIRAIVRDVSHFAQPSAGARRRIALHAAVSEAVSVFRLHDRGKDVRVAIECQTDPPPVEATEGQIVQVVLNLLLNAADASDGGWINVMVGAAGGGAVVSVTDDGPGMSDEVVRRLFVPFFTTKDAGAGAGLGLFICESIVRAHGGRIDVDTALGRGSTFTVHLPSAA